MTTINRRRFLVGAAAASALVVAPRVLIEDDASRLERLAKTGRVRGEHFRLTRATRLMAPPEGLTISDCRFVMMDAGFEIGDGGPILIRDCSFDLQGGGPIGLTFS